MNVRTVATAAVILLAIWAVAVALGWPVRAHGPYSDWTAPDNPALSCCNDSDCRPTRAYMGDDGLWRAWDGINWLTIPPGRVLPTDYAGDGRNHLCEKMGAVYCFSPGQPRG